MKQWDKDVIKSAENNHIWLNAFACVLPSVEFKIQLADQIISMLRDKDRLIYANQDHEDKTWRAIGKLTPQLIVRINKS